jgi:6-phosphogluconolactonase (cycloisomerase 2 family)
MIEDGIFALANLDPEIKFSIYYDIQKKTKEIPYNKSFDLENPKNYLESANPRDIGFNKKHKILYTWNSVLNSIDLHDRNGVFIKSYSFGTNKNINNKKFEGNYFYYYKIKSYGDYIYGLYAGFNTVENFTESLIPNLKSEVHVFNVKTDEMKRYKLDRLINSCTIDFENNIIYCIEENSESQPLVKYEIDQKN